MNTETITFQKVDGEPTFDYYDNQEVSRILAENPGIVAELRDKYGHVVDNRVFVIRLERLAKELNILRVMSFNAFTEERKLALIVDHLVSHRISVESLPLLRIDGEL